MLCCVVLHYLAFPDARQGDSVWLTFTVLIGGCRAGVFWNSGLKEFALDWAAKTAKYLKHESLGLCSSHILLV